MACMPNVFCTMFCTLCPVCSVVHTLPCVQCCAHSALCAVLCTPCIVCSVVHTLPSVQFCAHSSLCAVLCILCPVVLCTVCPVYSVAWHAATTACSAVAPTLCMACSDYSVQCGGAHSAWHAAKPSRTACVVRSRSCTAGVARRSCAVTCLHQRCPGQLIRQDYVAPAVYKGKVFYGQEPPRGKSTTTECWVQLSTTCSYVLKQPNGELLVAVNHNQLRTVASETVDPIDWSHPPPSWTVPPERHVQSSNQCNLSGTRTMQPQHARQPPCLCGHSGYEILIKYI